MLVGVAVLPNMLNYQTQATKANEFKVRTIETANFSYAQQANLMLEKFNSYDADVQDSGISFNGEMNASMSELLGIEFLADKKGDVKKKFKTWYDFETGLLKLSISFYDENGFIEEICETAEPVIDEELDDAYIEYEGEKIYFSEVFDKDSMDNCSATVAVVAGGGITAGAVVVGGAVIVGALVISIVAADPTILTNTVTTVSTTVVKVVETIKSSTKRFFRWFTTWITRVILRPVTTTTTTTVTIKTPAITINNKRIETKEV